MVEGTVNLRAETRLLLLLLSTLKAVLQKIAGARSDGNGLRTVRGLKVKVHDSVEQFVCESASSVLDYSLPHTWVSAYGMWKKHAVYFYLSI